MKSTTLNSYFICFLIFQLSILNINGQSNYKEALNSVSKLGLFEKLEAMIGKDIFDFEANSINGDQLNTDSIVGKVAVLNFWFMSCTPCIAEIPGLNYLVEKYENNSDVKFISFTRDNVNDLNADFFPNHQFKFEIIADCEKFLRDEVEHQFGYPSTFIVDRNLKIRKIIIGGSSNETEATENVKSEFIPLIDECLSEN